MIQIVGLLLGVLLLILIVINYTNKKDIFHPSVIFLILEFIRYVPGLIVLKREGLIVYTLDGTIKLVLYELIYIISCLVSIKIFTKKNKSEQREEKHNLLTFNIFVLYLLGLVAKIIVIIKLGGLGFILSNGQLAYQMQSHGYGIYTIFYRFMQVAIIAMCEKACINRDTKKYKYYAAIMIIIYALSFLIYTNRTPAFIIALIVLYIYNYEIKKFNFKKFLNWKVLLIIVIIFTSSLYLTNKRLYSEVEVYNSPTVEMIKNLSNNGRDMFIYKYFSTHNKWYGRGYLNILPSLVPGRTSKPSTDDGIYLINIIRGADVDINQTYDSLPFLTGSVPFSTPGYMYANFGVLGIIIGGFIIGMIVSLIYNYMIKRINAFNVSIYLFITYSFGLSTGRMVPTIITIIFILIFEKLLKIKLKIRRKSNS